MNISDELVIIGRYRTPVEANIVKLKLEDNGVACVLSAMPTAGKEFATMLLDGVTVQVCASDVERATEIIQAFSVDEPKTYREARAAARYGKMANEAFADLKSVLASIAKVTSVDEGNRTVTARMGVFLTRIQVSVHVEPQGTASRLEMLACGGDARGTYARAQLDRIVKRLGIVTEDEESTGDEYWNCGTSDGL